MVDLTLDKVWSESLTIFTAALALVTAFSWRDAIDSVFTTYIKNPMLGPRSFLRKYPNVPRFVYAIILTSIVVLITIYKT